MPTIGSEVSETMVPIVVLPPETPFTAHVTLVLVVDVVDGLVNVTVATKSSVSLIGTEALDGVIAIAVISPELELLPLPHPITQTTTAARNTRKAPRENPLFISMIAPRPRKIALSPSHTPPRRTS